MKPFSKTSIAALCATICALVLAGCTSGTGERTVVVSEGGASPTITVTATNEVKAVPDKAEVGVSVVTQAATAEAAQEQNAADVNAVIDALKQLGVDDKSIQTTDTWLNPRYDYTEAVAYSDQTYATPAVEPNSSEDSLEETVDAASEETAASDAATADSAATIATPPAAEVDSADVDNSSTIAGYDMTTRLSITDLDIDKVGEIVAACVAAGANSTDGIRYYSSEYDAKYAEALAAAVDDARAKAETLAQASGVGLGAVYSMTEGYQNTAYRYDTGAMMEAATADSASMKVMPGEIDISASVTVSYEIS